MKCRQFSTLSPLAWAFLEELGVDLKRYHPDKRQTVLQSANEIARHIEGEFEAMRAAGQLVNLSRAYKLYARKTRARGGVPASYGRFVLDRKREFIRLTARERAETFVTIHKLRR